MTLKEIVGYTLLAFGLGACIWVAVAHAYRPELTQMQALQKWWYVTIPAIFSVFAGFVLLEQS